MSYVPLHANPEQQHVPFNDLLHPPMTVGSVVAVSEIGPRHAGGESSSLTVYGEAVAQSPNGPGISLAQDGSQINESTPMPVLSSAQRLAETIIPQQAAVVVPNENEGVGPLTLDQEREIFRARRIFPGSDRSAAGPRPAAWVLDEYAKSALHGGQSAKSVAYRNMKTREGRERRSALLAQGVQAHATGVSRLGSALTRSRQERMADQARLQGPGSEQSA